MTTGATIRTRLRAGVMDAMRRRDRVALGVYRQALAAIDNAEAVVPDGGIPAGGALEASALGVGVSEVARRELSDADVHDIVAAEVVEHRSAAGIVAERDVARAERHRRAAELLEHVLA